jgi:S-adenosylmethionine/arginine decarboxylase-like enzyme
MKTRIENWAGIVKTADERYLKTTLNKYLKRAGFNVLKYCEHQFQPYGFTCLWLLGESHLALQTFPENGSSYIELSSCIEKKGDKFWGRLKKEIKVDDCSGKRVIEEK